MGREMLDVGCQVQQVALVATFRMYGRYGKLAVGQRASLVEDDGVGLCKQIDVVGAATAESSNSNYVTVGVVANNKVTINGVAAGTAQVTVSDEGGNVIADLNVTVTA